MKRITITGIAGFIGFHLWQKLSTRHVVSGIDLLDNSLFASIARSSRIPHLIPGDILSPFIDTMTEKPDVVVHLSANTGIAGSLINPASYFQSNVQGTFNVLEQCRKNGVKYLIYASSSSVYEPNQSVMNECSPHEKQLSFYGTSKIMTEIMVENYCRQFGMAAIGLRFFTVYGSWTRPDMAAYKFMQNISQGKPVTLYNNGMVKRDFTHVSDIVAAIDLLVDRIQTEKSGFHEIFNIGFGEPVSVKRYAMLIAENLDRELFSENRKLPSNELELTYCDPSKLKNYIQFKPKTSVEDGVKEMVDWYKTGKYV